jgi:hypothetical protein
MAPTTRPYRNQHAEIKRLASLVIPRADGVAPEAAARALRAMRALLLVHLRFQDGMLYAWMVRHRTGTVRSTAHWYRSVTQTFLVTFLRFCDHWSDPNAIAREPKAFAEAWTCLRSLLLHRLEAEVRVLYPAIDAHASKPAALAS